MRKMQLPSIIQKNSIIEGKQYSGSLTCRAEVTKKKIGSFTEAPMGDKEAGDQN